MKSLLEHPVIKAIGLVQDRVNLVLMIVIPVLVTIQVLLRYVFHLPLMGIEELLLFPAIWLYMLGGASASRDRAHIECGVLVLYIRKERTLAVFRLARTLVSLVISCWLTYWAFWFFSYSLRLWKLSDLLYLPMFFGESAIFIGLVLMTFYTAIELMDGFRALPLKHRKAE